MARSFPDFRGILLIAASLSFYHQMDAARMSQIGRVPAE
jgi:hypothetical protein